MARGRVFVTDRQLDPDVERVLCFDEQTGEPLWAHSYPCDYENMEYGSGPRASPTVHEGRVYTLGTRSHLFCLSAATGDVLWKRDLVKECGAVVPQYGTSAAPLVEGDLLIVCAGGAPDASVIAFDRVTGEKRWKALNDRSAYSAPITINAGGCRQTIVWTADKVTALEPTTGNVYWEVPYRATWDPAQVVASPVLHEDLLLCLRGWSRGSMMLQLDAGKPSASVLWKTRSRPSTRIATPLFLDDRHFCSVDIDGSLRCLDVTSGEELWTTYEPTGRSPLANAHLTPNGDRVFLFNHRGHLILARLTPEGYQEMGRCLLVEPTAGTRAQGPVAWAHPAYANKCIFARNDRELVCASLAADQTIAVAPSTPERAAKSRVLGDYSGSNAALALAFSPDGKLLALGTWLGNVKLLDTSTGRELPSPPKHKYWVCSVAFSPDGKLLVSAGGNEFEAAGNAYQKNSEVRLWDVAAGVERAQLEGHTDKVLSAAFSPDNKTLATGSADRTVRLWDAATGESRTVFEGHADAVWSVAFSCDDRTVASASWDGTARLWDAATGQQRRVLEGHGEEVLAVAFAPDGRTLATGSADWTVRLWDAATGEQRSVLKGHHGAVYCLAFSPDGSTLASGSGDQTAKLWNLTIATENTTLRGHRSGISAVAFAPDGKTLATAGMEDAPRLWDLTTGK